MNMDMYIYSSKKSFIYKGKPNSLNINDLPGKPVGPISP